MLQMAKCEFLNTEWISARLETCQAPTALWKSQTAQSRRDNHDKPVQGITAGFAILNKEAWLKRHASLLWSLNLIVEL
jgi:hypothetical protein